MTKIVEQLRQAAKDCTWMAKQHEKDTLYSLAADEIERLRSALMELRIRLHAQGRRPEECHEMSIIDDALQGYNDDEI
jgi:hypothetical protein